ncbi:MULTISPECIES: phage tail tube protein [Streptomyces]|uniref:phage tail tube protein n=1 Tax=Streptomyces TaxID=1883 RepID=UPI00163C37BD|nr:MULTISPECIES: phage tail protein [Streptomyces]MBC2877441.1 phage tail protein [Streptomyces sp. TYQ1024]UBI38239.1 phage tail protein [Streptomyces mobaraensis]UKW30825.1 phage tail protein [Streptomyces sp. TYQ1024]
MPGMNPNEVRVAGTGRVLIAKVGTDAPADTTTDWSANWRDLGYTTTDGVKFGRKGKTAVVDTWQSLSPARTIFTEHELTLKFSMLQLNRDTLPFFFNGGDTAETAAGSGVFKYEIQADPGEDERALGLEFSDGAEIRYRLVVPRGLVTVNDDVDFNRKGAVKLGVTFTAMSAKHGAPLATWLMKDKAYAAASPK